jgi:hypothetical protein
LGSRAFFLAAPGAVLCVQRHADADFTMKAIYYFVGCRSLRSTKIYAKVAVEQLR